MKLGNLVTKAMELWKTMMSWRRSNNHATEQMARHRRGKVEISKVDFFHPPSRWCSHDFLNNEWFIYGKKKHHPHLFQKKTQVCPKLKALENLRISNLFKHNDFIKFLSWAHLVFSVTPSWMEYSPLMGWNRAYNYEQYLLLDMINIYFLYGINMG